MFNTKKFKPLIPSDYQLLRHEFSNGDFCENEDYLRYMMANNFNGDRKKDMSKSI